MIIVRVKENDCDEFAKYSGWTGGENGNHIQDAIRYEDGRVTLDPEKVITSVTIAPPKEQIGDEPYPYRNVLIPSHLLKKIYLDPRESRFYAQEHI